MRHHLLPVKHFHLIFTVPQQLNDLIFYNKKQLYDLMFQVAAQTVNTILGGKTGMVSTLHSWGSNLSFHPHIHVIVAAGSWHNGTWQPSHPTNPNCFCPAKELRQTYQALFLKRLRELIEFEDLKWGTQSIDEPDVFPKIQQIYKEIQRKKWTVRIENPVLGVGQIVEYLARYVRRVAITNSRIEEVNEKEVIINYKQYAQQKKGQAPPIGRRTFKGAAFIQQFAQHFMPRGFHKVRYYGFYSFGAKQLKADIHQFLVGQPPSIYQKPSKKAIVEQLLGHDMGVCTNCGVVDSFVTLPLDKQPTTLFRLRPSSAKSPIRAGPPSVEAISSFVF